MKKAKRTLSLLFALVLVLGLLPTSALAADIGSLNLRNHFSSYAFKIIWASGTDIVTELEPYEGKTISEIFPDDAFRKYVTDTILADVSEGKGDDDVVTDEQMSIIGNTTEVCISGLEIAALDGIEYFCELVELNCSNNSLKLLDVRANRKLKTLDVSGNSKLNALDCTDCELTSLNLSECTALANLDCPSNNLTALDVSGCTALKYLQCSNNQLAALDVSSNTALNDLDCSYNQLTELDVSKNTVLEVLDCERNKLKTLNVSGDTALVRLYCCGNQLTTLDVSKNTSLSSLDCHGNQLADLDVSKNTALNQLICYSNQLTELDVSRNTALQRLDCERNKLTALDVSSNTALERLYCNNNQLTMLDVSENTELYYLCCYNNQLTALDVSKNTALRRLLCYNNQLKTLDVSSNAALYELYCSSNRLTTLDVSKNTALMRLCCYNNELTALDVSKNKRLAVIRCENNHIPYLNLAENTALGNVRYAGSRETLISLAPQTLPSSANVTQSGNKWQLDMSEVLGKGDVSKVEMTDGSTYDVKTGIATYTTKPEKISYTYDTGCTDKYSHGVIDRTFSVSGAVLPENIGTLTFKDAFPDEIFRAYVTDTVLKNSTEPKGDNDNITAAQMTAIQNCKTVDVRVAYFDRDAEKDKIKSLEGIEYFTSLEELNCNNNQLTALDVSKNTALEDLRCSDNLLAELDVSKNTALYELFCADNQLTELDVSSNPALESLYCGGNQLTMLDVSKNTALKWLSCYNNQLTALDVSKNTALKDLSCGGNKLTELDVSSNPALGSLDCDNNQLTALDVSSNAKLWSLNCYNNQLTELDVSKNTELNALFCSDNLLTALDVSENTKLCTLYCYNNQLTLLDLSKNTELCYLHCDGNQLTTLDVSNNTELTRLYCNSNQLTKLNVSGNTTLWELNCAYNQLTELDVSKSTELITLYCDNNQLSTLDVSKNTELSGLLCDNNQLTTLDVSKNTELRWLYCNGNQLTALDVSNNMKLRWLFCYNNKLTELDVSQNTWLIELRCENNHIPYLDLTKNTELGNSEYADEDEITISLAPQTLSSAANVTQTGDKWQLDMSKVLGGGDIAKVTMTDGSTYDAKTGIATYTAKPDKISYTYDTGCTDKYNYGVIDRTFSVSGAILPEGVGTLTFADAFPDEIFRTYVTETVLEDSTDPKGDNDTITAAQVSAIQNCKTVDVDRNNENKCAIKSLEGIEYFTALERLSCDNNQLTTLDVSSNTALQVLRCNSNQLTALDVSDCTALNYLRCSNNQLKTLDVSGNTALEVLGCYNNQLTALDVSKNTALSCLECSDNQFTTLNVSKNTELLVLLCDGNQLTALDVSKNAALEYLLCIRNQLAALDVSKNTALKTLWCSDNQLKTLDVSSNTVLKRLICDDNQLKSLDVSKNTALEEFSCENNQITALDVSQNTKLTELRCENNHIPYLDLAKNTELGNNPDAGVNWVMLRLAPQTLSSAANVTQTGDKWQLDMSKVLNGGNIAKVTMTDGSTYDKATGIATYATKPSRISYTYDTGCTDKYNYGVIDRTFSVSGDVNVTTAAKRTPTLTVRDITRTYDGEAVPASAIRGTAKVDGAAVAGKWSFKDNAQLKNVKDSGKVTVVFTPNDTAAYESAEKVITVTIEQAEPEGKPEFEEISEAGKTLRDIQREGAMNKVFKDVDGDYLRGEFEWDKNQYTEIEQGKSYGWTFTPDDENYSEVTGSFIPWRESAGGNIISVSDSAHGSVTVNPVSAPADSVVTVTIRPDSGYELDKLTVTDKNGKALAVTKYSDTIYYFTAPGGPVTVKASFKLAQSAPAVSFVDVPANAYYADAVAWAVANGVTTGSSDTTFSPNAVCTRAEMMTFLWRAAGSPEPRASGSFKDVSASAYYAKAVAWAVENGITNGTGTNTFSPNKTCDRSQMATFLWRFAGSPSAYGASFTDVPTNAYYASAVAWALSNGITEGTSATTYSPTASCTRAQIVTFLYRYMA